jgi:hypothetical protein
MALGEVQSEESTWDTLKSCKFFSNIFYFRSQKGGIYHHQVPIMVLDARWKPTRHDRMFCFDWKYHLVRNYLRFEKPHRFEQFSFIFVLIFSMNVHKNDPPAKTMRVRKKLIIYILFTKYPACRRSQKNLIYVNTWLWGRSKVKSQIEKPYYRAYFFKQFSFSISKRGYISPSLHKFASNCKRGAH